MTDLARRVALAIEPEPGPLRNNPVLSSTHVSPMNCWYERGGEWRPNAFSTDRNLLPLILAEVERRGARDLFVDRLEREVGTGGMIKQDLSAFLFTAADIMALLNATPEQICRAFLAAVGADHA